MKGKDLFRALQRKLGAKNQAELARLLDKHQTQLSGLKNKELSPVTIAAWIAKFHDQIITADRLLPKLEKKLGTRSHKELADVLGMTGMALHHWKHRASGLSAQQIAGAIEKSRESASRQSLGAAVRPIVEFFPIGKTLKNRHYSVFDGRKGGQYREGLRKVLEEKHGLYMFYDSRGQALYAGKATRQYLWREINNAFNRVRSKQSMTRVRHPIKNDVQFVSTRAIARHPREVAVKLNELAGFFSAYEVAPAMIANLEALIIRAFPNDLLNLKMERFKHSSTKAKRKRSRRQAGHAP